MPDEARQDPMFLRTRGGQKGRDGCRVPIPWLSDAPSYGFGPSAASWLPQPAIWAELALDRQRGVPGSTYELYRAALRRRAQHGLGTGALAWAEAPDGVLAFQNGDVYVLTNFGETPATLPAGARPLISSEPLDPDGRVPTDVTVWAAV
jgi:alpha-glucosidase